jgi:hypothetical protein
LHRECERETIMNMSAASRFQVSLEHQALFDIADAAGATVRCERGNLWITLDNDPRDIVLRPGEEFSTDERRHALVYALSPATLTVMAREQEAPRPTRVSFGLRAVPA